MLSPRGLCHGAGENRDRTQGQQPGNDGRGSAELALVGNSVGELAHGRPQCLDGTARNSS